MPSLKSYRDKRHDGTNEPLGDEPGERAPSTWRGAFVVHQHDATHMHWDLRLEIGGVLASFAIPKGPTLHPDARHFAAHTEDHPIEYLDFEAVIPDGNYGAGPMICWDFGAVRYLDACAEDGLRDGKLHFSLEGRKLLGRFGLVRTKAKGKKGELGSEWLLLKKADAAASTTRDILAEQPRSVLSGLTISELASARALGEAVIHEARTLRRKHRLKDGRAVDARKLSPMLCSFGDVPGEGYVYELKMDGVRVIAGKDARGVELTYRSGRSTTAAYPEVARAVAALPVDELVLDGEIVAFDEAGRPNFERLARRIHGKPRTSFESALCEVQVVFVVFDLLSVGGVSLCELPLIARKALLRRLVPGAGIVRALDHLERGGQELLAFCRENKLEGVVSKRADSPYVAGPGRTSHWIKTKCEQEACFVVVGYTHGEGSRHRLGALDLASFEGDDLVLRGRVGSGLSDDRVDDLLARLAPLTLEARRGAARPREGAGPPVRGDFESAPRGRVHVRPELVVRVRYLEWSEEGALRFPVFLGLEHDVDPASCRVGPHDEDHAVGAAPEAPAAAPEISVRISNRGKVFWPDGTTKGDLIDYYAAIAPVLLPYLEDRPVMLVRYPDGVEGKSFYQWNVPHGMPSWVRSVELGKHARSAEEADQKKHVFLIDRLESLLYIANLACIPVHILGSRVASPDVSDFLVIDFDVAQSSLAVAVQLAFTLRGLLDELGLCGFPKTSGQTGLHVFVPLGAGFTPAAARTLADLLGRLIVERHPEDATVERVVERRGAKVYVDTGQTGASRTIVAPYSLRAAKEPRVSTPLAWAELDATLDPAAFTLRSVPPRVAAHGDPMAGLLAGRADAGDVMRRLAGLVGPASAGRSGRG